MALAKLMLRSQLAILSSYRVAAAQGAISSAGCTLHTPDRVQTQIYGQVAQTTSCLERNFNSHFAFSSSSSSKYNYNTDFLGTPDAHADLKEKRPISPHLFPTTEGPIPTSMHFKLPITAISSVTNRATGLGLTVGFAGASAIALTGDLPGTIDFMKETYPFLIPPAKFIVAFPLVYHTLGGLRHIVWDTTAAGFDLKTMKLTSQLLFGISVASSVYLSVITLQ